MAYFGKIPPKPDGTEGYASITLTLKEPDDRIETIACFIKNDEQLQGLQFLNESEKYVKTHQDQKTKFFLYLFCSESNLKLSTRLVKSEIVAHRSTKPKRDKKCIIENKLETQPFFLKPKCNHVFLPACHEDLKTVEFDSFLSTYSSVVTMKKNLSAGKYRGVQNSNVQDRVKHSDTFSLSSSNNTLHITNLAEYKVFRNLVDGPLLLFEEASWRLIGWYKKAPEGDRITVSHLGGAQDTTDIWKTSISNQTGGSQPPPNPSGSTGPPTSTDLANPPGSTGLPTSTNAQPNPPGSTGLPTNTNSQDLSLMNLHEEERVNFFQLILLLFRDGNQKLREFFKSQWPVVYQKKTGIPPPSLWTDIPNDATEMKNIETKPLKFQFNAQKVNFNSGDTNTWDFSLITTVLNNSTLKFVTPLTPESKAIKELKEIRNERICHAPDAKIPTAVFNTEWPKACNALKAFGVTQDDIDQVKKDVKKPVYELLPFLNKSLKVEKEILDAINKLEKTIKDQHQETRLVIQQGKEDVKATIREEVETLSGPKKCYTGELKITEAQSTLLDDRFQHFKDVVIATELIDSLPCLSLEQKNKITYNERNYTQETALKTLIDAIKTCEGGFEMFVRSLVNAGLVQLAVLLDPDCDDNQLTDIVPLLNLMPPSISMDEATEKAKQIAVIFKLDKNSVEDPPDDIKFRCRKFCKEMIARGQSNCVQALRNELPSGMTGPLQVKHDLLVKDMDLKTKDTLSKALTVRDMEWKIFAKEEVNLSADEVDFLDKRKANPVLEILNEHCGDWSVDELYTAIVDCGANPIADRYL